MNETVLFCSVFCLVEHVCYIDFNYNAKKPVGYEDICISCIMDLVFCPFPPVLENLILIPMTEPQYHINSPPQG